MRTRCAFVNFVKADRAKIKIQIHWGCVVGYCANRLIDQGHRNAFDEQQVGRIWNGCRVAKVIARRGNIHFLSENCFNGRQAAHKFGPDRSMLALFKDMEHLVFVFRRLAELVEQWY